MVRFAFLVLFSSSALAAPRAFVAAARGDEAASDRPVEARRGEPVHLYAVVERDGHFFTDAPALRLAGRKVAPRRLQPWADLGPDLAITWLLVEPRQHHFETPPPNFGNPAYSNNVLFGARHGQWLGHDALEYVQTPLVDSGPVLTVVQAQPLDKKVKENGGLGTVRYAVQVAAGATVWQSPGAEAQGKGGISPRVMRVSFRRGDDLPGWLTSFFNVPNLFGSAGQGAQNQAELHQGADCADVLVAAMRKAGRSIPYTSVSGLFSHGQVITPRLWMDPTGLYALNEDGTRGEPVRLDRTDPKSPRPGDLMVIDYGILAPTGRTWDHIGMLDEDAGEAGVLDVDDPLFHMGYLAGLERAPIRAHRMATIQFLRMRPR